jgi:RNA-directed DNA polymerase
VTSPLLANVALDGMEKLFGAVNSRGTQLSPALKRGRNKGIGLVRYADDFVVTAPNRGVLEDYVRPVLDDFLAQRGLKLSEAKTKIVHVDEGFNFLGFTIRRLGKKVLTKPQKEKVLLHLQDIRDFLVRNRTTPTSIVIDGLNPVIRGWAAYYRYGVSKATLQYADHRLWQMLWRWSIRRHRNKPRKWVKARYFTRVGNRDWVFFGQREHTGKRSVLTSHANISVKRYFKVHGRMTPMNPEEAEFWAKRKRERLIDATYWKGRRHLLERQGSACALCGIQFDPEQDIHFTDRHHDQPRHAGGTDHPDNLIAVHRWCHHAHHMRSGYRAAVA